MAHCAFIGADLAIREAIMMSITEEEDTPTESKGQKHKDSEVGLTGFFFKFQSSLKDGRTVSTVLRRLNFALQQLDNYFYI